MRSYNLVGEHQWINVGCFCIVHCDFVFVFLNKFMLINIYEKVKKEIIVLFGIGSLYFQIICEYARCIFSSAGP